MLHERASITPYSKRRLTRDWRILAEDVEDYQFSKCTTRQKGISGELWLGSNVDLHDLLFNTLEFVTGSTYEGQCSKIGMEGVGTYTFPHGVVYEGHFKEGMFHGKGILIYPQGQALNCTYHKGKLMEWEFIFNAPHPPSNNDDDINNARKMSRESEESLKLKTGVEINPRTYCQVPDRRFYISYSEGLRGAPKENLADERPSRNIPKGCYDVGDGFYNPETRWVHRVGDMGSLLYMIPEKQKKPELSTEKARRKFTEKIPHVPVYKTDQWIKEHCRKAGDEAVGYKPNLYEYWFSGREDHRQKLNMRSIDEGGKFMKKESINEECLKHFQEISDSPGNTYEDAYNQVD